MRNIKKKSTKDRRFKAEKVVPFTFYIHPNLDREVRSFAQRKDLTLTKVGNKALRLFLQAEKASA